MPYTPLPAILLLLATSTALRADDLLIEGFESGTYKFWTLSGDAFGGEPARGTLADQMSVSGFRGERLVNTFHGGDAATGTATSRPFKIERPHIAFLIGGGRHPDSVGIELLVDGRSVRSATGHESEELEWSVWDVREFAGQTARLRIFDKATGGWGHINIDHIIQTTTPPARFDLDFQLAEYRRSADYLNEPLRPQAHFSPEINWMNDPNGLVYHNGEYHLFFQYNPAGNTWGHMSWGHAVSRDLIHWEHLPLAIPEADGVMAFSGCCVVDHRNTSGFGKPAQLEPKGGSPVRRGSPDPADAPTAGLPADRVHNPPLVAIYTGHGHGKQVQNLAYSTDNGRTWTKYAHNPILDINSSDFRDPKVFWHEPTNRWVMVVSLAVEKVLVFYGSPDLKQWTELSRFGPAGAKDKLNWECPDLFELPVENEDGRKLWVLEADMGNGAIAGGSGGEYFVGHFDGTAFTPLQDARWVDYGRDFYAPISWSDIPESDGRRIWIGWFNNWETCLVPTHPWRGAMSVPRTLALRRVRRQETGDREQESSGGRPDATVADDDTDRSHDSYVLVQRPVAELRKLRRKSLPLDTSAAAWPPVAVTRPGDLSDMNFVLEATLQPGTARSCGVRIRTGPDEYTEIGYDRVPAAVYVDRRHSGNVQFHPAFPGRHEAPTRILDGQVTLEIIVDRSSIEVFINDGEAVISDRIFPTGRQPIIEVFAGDPSAGISDATLHELRSIWTKRDPARTQLE